MFAIIVLPMYTGQFIMTGFYNKPQEIIRWPVIL